MTQFFETYRGNEKLSPLVREISRTNSGYRFATKREGFTPSRFVVMFSESVFYDALPTSSNWLLYRSA
jgi:hypothetical protein